jgi:proton-coupled amino acid transporter
MKEPHKFPKVLTGVMIGVAALFAGFGVMGYAAYGSNIQTVVIVNLPQEDKFVQVVQFLYTIAIVLRSAARLRTIMMSTVLILNFGCSLPLQLFPAVRIWENGLFVRSGKHDPKVKWEKNIFRAGIVLLCSLISWAGASNLDGFVSFIGSFAW